MNICILGKYPPIEGGVSTHTYWLARGLAERGHQVHVVTNADEVEEMFRITLGPEDWPWYEPQFEAGGGQVRVVNPEPFSRRAMGHIPEANPFVSKLASLATDVVRRERCDLILAYYYEPYGVAGWLASRWTSRPLVIKHAGSDLDRLMHVPDLATTYKQVLRTADGVVTQPRLMPRFLGMGVRRKQLRADIAYGVPAAVFNAEAQPLPVDRLTLEIGIGRPQPFDPALPTIGVYGKIGGSKGTFDLIAALGMLKREEKRFNFVAMVGQAQGDAIAPALRDEGLGDRSHVLPMLANWRVPGFVRSCTAVCFLERDFPVEIHGPIIAREVLACGTCLVLSGEIAAKQRYRDHFAPGENLLVVTDPKEIATLADALRSVIDDPVRARAIGARGALITDAIGDHAAYISGWEALLAQYAGGPDAGLQAQALPPGTSVDVLEGLETTLPDLLHHLRQRCPTLVEEFLAGAEPAAPRDSADRFCRFVEARLPRDAFGEQTPKLLSALRYARARVQAVHDPAGDNAPAFAVADRLQREPVSSETVAALRPVRGHAVRIETFDHDVSALFCEAALFGQPLRPDEAVERALAAIPAASTIVLFQRTPNLIACELHIDAPTRELVEACDGSRTTDELLDHLCRRFGASAPAERQLLGERLLGALARLYHAGVIVFGERPPGWGWAGGLRAPLEGPMSDGLTAGET